MSESPSNAATEGCAAVTGSGLAVDDWVINYPHEDGDAEVVNADIARDLERNNIRLRAEIESSQIRTPDTEILDWMERHAVSVKVMANEKQHFVIPANRAAIRFEMTAGNVQNDQGDQPATAG